MLKIIGVIGGLALLAAAASGGINSLYRSASGLLFGGGITIAVMWVMSRKAVAVAETGSWPKMINWAVAPSLMVIAAVLVGGIAVNIAFTHLQSGLNSAPFASAVKTGDQMTQMVDDLFAGALAGGNGGGSYNPSDLWEDYSVNGGGGEPLVEYTAPRPAPQSTTLPPVVESRPTATLPAVQESVRSDLVKLAGRDHVVMPGETLGRIAKIYYGSSTLWPAICRSNSLGDCSTIRAGMVLKIPALNDQQVADTQSAPMPIADSAVAADGIGADGRVYYNVKPIPIVPASAAVGNPAFWSEPKHVAAPTAIVRQPVRPTPSAAEKAVAAMVVYDVPTPVIPSAVDGVSAGALPVIVFPTATPRPANTPAPSQKVGELQVELGFTVDTGVPSIGSTTGGTGTVGN